MIDPLRQEIAGSASPIVVKVGTRVLTKTDGRLDYDRIADLADQLHQLRQANRHVVLVSSGAVGAGMSELGLTARPSDLAKLQAVAAIGQTKLIEAYDRTLRQQGHHAAQVLLTARDLSERNGYLNVRNTLLSLLDLGAIPIINENDTVAVDELMKTFGDNDRLAAMVTNLLRAPLLIILSDVAGLFDGPPGLETSKLIPTVERIDTTIASYVQDHRTGLSKGGMASKLEAARMCTMAGENVILAHGREPRVLERITRGETVGTAFIAQGKSVSPWKRWIGFSAPAGGIVHIDEGACDALISKGKSLLAIGIRDVTGDFEKGDVVALQDSSGHERARGLTNYASDQLRKIMGLRSDQIADTLGQCPYVEVIHRDNMTITHAG
ncbi:MAG: glutamate 5-kinase [Planctomycetales bacterium]|nr:glutamate 5-kinase [Planctomycetales bacterium]